jgi:hypothetical protein
VPLAVPVVALTVHGCPLAGPEKVTGSPVDVALTENPVLPYCTLGTGPQVMVCDCVVDPCGRMVNVPDTGVAAL